MYINAYKETHNNLYLVKEQNVLSMISFEIERIFEKEDVCEIAEDFLPRLKDIKQLAEKHETTDDEVAFFQDLKGYNHLETDGFKFIIENTPNDHVWVSVEYVYYDATNMDDVTYTSTIEHIDDID